MADEKKRIIQLPALDLDDVPVGAFFPVDSATDEQDSNTGAHKVAVSDVLDAIADAKAKGESAEQVVQDLADDVETLSEECARNDIIAIPYIEDGSAHGYRPNAIVTYANKLYQNQTGGSLMQIDFNPSVWTEITVSDYIYKLCENFAEEWESGQSYDVGDIVIQAGQLYRCKRATSASSISPLDWDEITVVDLLSEGGRIQDVYVNGTSVVDLNKIAQIKSYKEVTQAEYDALPSSKLTDDILYCIKDSGADIVNDVRRNGTSIVENGVADIGVDSTPTYNSANLITSGGVSNAITSLQQQIASVALSIEAEWYNGNNTYNVGDYVWNGSTAIGLYKCIETTTGTWDSSKWEPVTVTSELQKKADKSYVDETIDKLLIHGTASGDIASFSDGADFPMKSLKVAIEPQQDLHGYDSPWVGGAGKNKLQVTATSQTISGVTFTVNDDGTIIANGTATQNISLQLSRKSVSDTPLPEGQLIMTGCPSGGSTSSYYLTCWRTNSGNANDVGNGVTFTYQSDWDFVVSLVITAGTTCNNLTIKPMIRLASESDATFAPYSNICPISGWTEEVVSVRGSNLIDITSFTPTYTLNGITYTINSDGSVVANGTATSRSQVYWSIPQDVAKTFTNKKLSGLKTHEGCSLFLELNGSPYTNYGTDTGEGTNIDSSIENANTTVNLVIRITSGTTVSNYVVIPRITDELQTYTIPFTDSQGNPVEVYGGSVDVVNGGEQQRTKAKIDLGSLNYTYYSGNLFTVRISDLKPVPNEVLCDALCSIYVAKKGNKYSSIDGSFVAGFNNSPVLAIHDSRFTDVTAFKTAMAGQKLVYELATPTTFYTQPTSIKSLDGENNVWADTGKIEECEYIRDTNIVINKLLEAIEN